MGFSLSILKPSPPPVSSPIHFYLPSTAASPGHLSPIVSVSASPALSSFYVYPLPFLSTSVNHSISSPSFPHRLNLSIPRHSPPPRPRLIPGLVPLNLAITFVLPTRKHYIMSVISPSSRKQTTLRPRPRHLPPSCARSDARQQVMEHCIKYVLCLYLPRDQRLPEIPQALFIYYVAKAKHLCSFRIITSYLYNFSSGQLLCLSVYLSIRIYLSVCRAVF